MLSIIIPAHKEPYLQKTIDTVLSTSELDGRLEIVVIWDGTEFEEAIRDDMRVKVVRLPEYRGMRGAINAGIEAAQGKYLMKLDAHCSVGQGFDRIMLENGEVNWVLYPRRYALFEPDWSITDTSFRPPRDSYHFRFPELNKNGYGLNPYTCRWWDRKMGSDPIIDSMGFEGSCWMVNRDYFKKCIGLLDDRIETYGPYHSESTEIAMNYWLGDGEVKVNRKTWYAHLTKRPRHYKTGVFMRMCKDSNKYTWATKFWMNDEHGKSKPFRWLIEKFWPIPTWPDDWQKVWQKNYETLGDNPGAAGTIPTENY